ncbi:MAG: D-aminoacyl-tRNA deacylase [Pseudomonadota bacterium]
MKALLQRVTRAEVLVGGNTIGAIGPGLLVFLGLDTGDNLENGKRLLDKVLAYRVFADEEGRMNRSVIECAGGVLLVSQFTLSADTGRGLRPSFSSALAPADAKPLFASLYDYLSAQHASTACGQFGADMQISLVNDGPVTFLLEA